MYFIIQCFEAAGWAIRRTHGYIVPLQHFEKFSFEGSSQTWSIFRDSGHLNRNGQ